MIYIHLQADGIPGRWLRAWPTLQSIATPVRVKNQRTATPSTTEQIRSRDAGPAHISLMGNEEPSNLQQYTKWLFPWMLPFQRRNKRGRKIANLHSAQQTAGQSPEAPQSGTTSPTTSTGGKIMIRKARQMGLLQTSKKPPTETYYQHIAAYRCKNKLHISKSKLHNLQKKKNCDITGVDKEIVVPT